MENRIETIEAPTKLSEIIDLGTLELDNILNNEDFEINMDHYIDLSNKKKCKVCLAGAVMVGLNKYKKENITNAEIFLITNDETWDDVFRKLDLVRQGGWDMLLQNLERPDREIIINELNDLMIYEEGDLDYGDVRYLIQQLDEAVEILEKYGL